MNESGKSDSPVVPVKLSNKFPDRDAERVEGRGLAKGNLRVGYRMSKRPTSGAPTPSSPVRKAKPDEPFIARLARAPRDLRPRARRETSCLGTGRSRERRNAD